MLSSASLRRRAGIWFHHINIRLFSVENVQQSTSLASVLPKGGRKSIRNVSPPTSVTSILTKGSSISIQNVEVQIKEESASQLAESIQRKKSTPSHKNQTQRIDSTVSQMVEKLHDDTSRRISNDTDFDANLQNANVASRKANKVQKQSSTNSIVDDDSDVIRQTVSLCNSSKVSCSDSGSGLLFAEVEAGIDSGEMIFIPEQITKKDICDVCMPSLTSIRPRSRRRSSADMLSDLQQKVQLLESEQASLSEVNVLIKKRAFKSATPEQIVAVLKVLKQFCPSGEKACQVLAKNAGVIWQPVELLQQRLQVLADFQVGDEALLRLATSFYMLSAKVEKLKEALTFLRDIGLSVQSVNKIICKNPKILGLSVENSMQPTVDFLKGTGMSDLKVLKLLERRPELFAMSIDSNLMVKYKFFQDLGLSAKKFSTALRSMTQYSNDTILARLNAIKEQGFSDDDVLEMVRKQPNILANSAETIKNKLHYLLNEQNRAMSEVVKFPTCLGYSLEERIIPRFNFLKDRGLLKPYSLSTILATKDSDFMERCKVNR